jgi:vacuolar protein sorting-associated protein 11
MHLIGETAQNGDGNGKAAAAECPLCAPQNAMIKQMRKAQEESAGMHDLFVDELSNTRERFGTVAEWFGRGVMNGQSVVE